MLDDVASVFATACSRFRAAPLRTGLNAQAAHTAAESIAIEMAPAIPEDLGHARIQAND